jgi:hypothetical protein
VNLAISARARLEVTTDIPSQSSGRFLDSLTDIFRPFSERRGLKADQVRLQREDVLLEIALKARERLAVEAKNPSPLPNKFLVPFLEKASLEEKENTLIDRWADLLVSCSLEPDKAHPRFVQLLSEMVGEDANLLRKIAATRTQGRKRWLEDSLLEFDPVHLQWALESWLRDNPDVCMCGMSDDNFEKEFQKIISYELELFGHPGVSLIDIHIWDVEEDVMDSINFNKLEHDSLLPLGIDKNSFEIDTLISLHLLAHHQVKATFGRRGVEVFYVAMTPIGIELVLKCDRELAAMNRPGSVVSSREDGVK